LSLDDHDGLVSASDAGAAVPIRLVAEAGLEAALAEPRLKALATQAEFKAQAGRLLLVNAADGTLEAVLLGLGKGGDPMLARGLPSRLPPGDYRFEGDAGLRPDLLALAWAFGGRVFDRYKADLRAKADRRPRLVVEGDVAALRRTAHACALARDMVDTPANDMGPRQIESIAREIAEQFGAEIAVTEGEALRVGYPAVAAVGRAAAPERAPRMIELSWSGGGPDAPLVALVGKGVVFDTGGLDLKPSAGMRIMKKDMGGAAHALALGRMVMAAGLKLRLVVLLAVAENAVGGDAMRPGDVLDTRKGLTVEVGNTDAEGRLVLADALHRAAEHAPELTLDFATLTGAARVALGPELPPLFTDDEALAAEILDAARTEHDPVWRMPLWPGYAASLDSEVADLANDPAGWAQAGAVTAALFLKRFAPETGAWAHLDVFAWNARGRPGWPVGGEVFAVRALFKVLSDRYGPRQEP
jgi:leucyl aminopeptidase